MDLGNLCDDILVKILSFLNAIDLQNVMMVNSSFYKLICDNYLLWRKFKLRLEGKKFNPAALIQSNRSFEYINIVRNYDHPSKFVLNFPEFNPICLF